MNTLFNNDDISVAQKALDRAVKDRDLQAAQHILQSFTLPQAVDAVHNAIQQEDCVGLKLLIQAGLGKDYSDIEYAVCYNKINALQLLLDEGWPMEPYHIAVATGGGHIECFKALIKAGCPVDDQDAIYYATRNGDIQCLEVLLKAGCPMDERAIYHAATFGELECLKALIKAGYPVELEAAMGAAATGQFEPLKLLVESGCPFDFSNANIMK